MRERGKLQAHVSSSRGGDIGKCCRCQTALRSLSASARRVAVVRVVCLPKPHGWMRSLSVVRLVRSHRHCRVFPQIADHEDHHKSSEKGWASLLEAGRDCRLEEYHICKEQRSASDNLAPVKLRLWVHCFGFACPVAFGVKRPACPIRLRAVVYI